MSYGKSTNPRSSFASSSRSEVFLNQLEPFKPYKLQILGNSTLYQLSIRLDHDDVHYTGKNWEAMAEFLSFNNWEILQFKREKLRTAAIVRAWSVRDLPTIGDIITLIHYQMGRHDIFTDQNVIDCIVRDANRAMANGSNGYSGAAVDGRNSTGPSNTCIPESFPEVQLSNSASTNFGSFRTDDMYGSNQVQDARVSQSHEWLHENHACLDVYIVNDVWDSQFVIDDLIPRLSQVNITHGLPEDIPSVEIGISNQLTAMLSRCRKIIVVLSDQDTSNFLLTQINGKSSFSS
uniref:uncharacterized protein LOC120344899 n=1 Tax=Styela clava TaxID=7725 RepID=UPI001939476A|nr:uncharacterized protein LOC120344899 [Styela clava]